MFFLRVSCAMFYVPISGGLIEYAAKGYSLTCVFSWRKWSFTGDLRVVEAAAWSVMEIRNPLAKTSLDLALNSQLSKKNMWVHQTSATTSSHGCGFIFLSLPLTSFWCVAKAIKSQPREMRFSSSFDFVTCEPNGSDRVLVTIGVTPIKN